MTKKVEVHKRRMEMSFVTAGSAAGASAENSLKATSAMLMWTAEASQVEAMAVSLCSGVFYANAFLLLLECVAEATGSF